MGNPQSDVRFNVGFTTGVLDRLENETLGTENQDPQGAKNAPAWHRRKWMRFVIALVTVAIIAAVSTLVELFVGHHADGLFASNTTVATPAVLETTVYPEEGPISPSPSPSPSQIPSYCTENGPVQGCDNLQSITDGTLTWFNDCCAVTVVHLCDIGVTSIRDVAILRCNVTTPVAMSCTVVHC